MIYEVTMFAAKCDGCSEKLYDGSHYSCMGDDWAVLNDMDDLDWHITEDNKHYCPSCFTHDSEGEVVIKTRTEK